MGALENRAAVDAVFTDYEIVKKVIGEYAGRVLSTTKAHGNTTKDLYTKAIALEANTDVPAEHRADAAADVLAVGVTLRDSMIDAFRKLQLHLDGLGFPAESDLTVAVDDSSPFTLFEGVTNQGNKYVGVVLSKPTATSIKLRGAIRDANTGDVLTGAISAGSATVA